MNRNLAHFLSRRIWPDGDLDMLLGAVLLPAGEAADCWREWKSRRDVEEVTWEEHKIFARLAGRLASIAPDCPYRPRLEGLSRAHWTQSQIMLRSSAGALDVLIDDRIPVMLLKGGALHAATIANQGPRVTSDLDVLVRRDDFPRAVKILYNAGWVSKNSVEYASARWRFASGTNLRLRPHGDIDIHHQPLHGARVTDDVLEAFWVRAEQVDFHGRPVWIPSLADLLVLASANAVRSHASNEPSAAWVFDIAMLSGQAALQPDQVVASASAFKAIPATIATLAYLRCRNYGQRVEELLTAIENDCIGLHPWLQFVLESMKRPHGKLLRSLVRRVSRPDGFESERDVVARIHPRYFIRQAENRVTSGAAGPQLCRRHEIPLPPTAATAKRLVIELSFQPVIARRYQFDIAVDDLPLARLSARVRKTGSVVSLRCVAILPSAGSALRQLAVESLATTSLPANASAARIRAAAPVPFRLISMSWN